MGGGCKGLRVVSSGGLCSNDIEGACSVLPAGLLLLLVAAGRPAVTTVSLAQARSLYSRSLLLCTRMSVRLQTGDSELTVQSLVHPWPS
jgi:hypothetical protein